MTTRTFKFRAWEKALKEMIPVYNIDFENGMLNTGSVWRFFDEVELMQFTGLKDKNGKEIYEGDIIRTQTMHYNGSGQFIGMTDRIASVVFHNGRFALRMESGAMPDLSFGLRFNEVIGNIYENPELLKGAKA